MIHAETYVNGQLQRFTDWLYGPYDEEKLQQFRLLYSIYPIRLFMDYQLDLRNDENYLKANQMTYSDIYDPRKLSSTSSGASYFGYTYSMVSNNIDRLYR